MKFLPALVLAFVLLSCGKKDGGESATTDSISSTSDSIPVEAVAETTASESVSESETDTEPEEFLDPPPPESFAENHYDDGAPEIDSIDFFNTKLWPEIYDDKPAEQASVETFMRMALDYAKLPLEPVTRVFKRKYKEDAEDEGGTAYTSVTWERGSETWLFDTTGNLRVYISIYKQSDDMNSFKYLKTVYLISGDTLVAGYEDEDQANQMAYDSRARFVRALCPACGGKIDHDAGATYYAYSPYGEKSMEYVVGVYKKKRDRIMRELKEGFPTAKPTSNGKRLKYSVTAKEDYPADTYKANLEIGKALYGKLFPGS